MADKVNRHGKSCMQCLQTILDKQQIFVVFTHQWPQVYITYPQLIYFCSKISNILEKLTFRSFLNDLELCEFGDIFHF